MSAVEVLIEEADLWAAQTAVGNAVTEAESSKQRWGDASEYDVADLFEEQRIRLSRVYDAIVKARETAAEPGLGN